MAAITVAQVDQGWAGDRKRNLAIFYNASTNADTVTPKQVGLRVIEAVVPTNRIGDLYVHFGTTASYTLAAAGLVSIAEATEHTTNSQVVVVATSEVYWEAYVYGW